MDLDSKQRKIHDILETSGYGLLVLNLWMLVKTLIYYLCAPDVVYDLCFSLYGDEIFKTSVRVSILVITLIDFAIQLYVGLTAIKVGKSRRKSRVPFIALAIVLSLLSLIYVLEDICYIFSEPFAIFVLLVDLFVLFVQVEIVVCGIKCKNKRTKGGK